MDIKVGDKIKVRKDLVDGRMYGKVECCDFMRMFLSGKEMTVCGIYPDGTFDAFYDNTCIWWISPEMIEKQHKSTRFERLKSMSVEEVAKNHIGWHTTFQLYFTSDGKAFEKEDYDEAWRHEIDWWNEEV